MDLAALRTEQQQRAADVVRQDDFEVLPPRLIAGADVGFEQGGEVTRAALVILEYPSLQLVEHQIARISTTMPIYTRFFIIPRSARSIGGLATTPASTGPVICRWAWHLASASARCGGAFWLAGGCTDHWCGKAAPVWPV